VDIKVFILTVVENSHICKFSRIYFIKFKKNWKMYWNYFISTYTSNFL